jgi:hypothetical protein
VSTTVLSHVPVFSCRGPGHNKTVPICKNWALGLLQQNRLDGIKKLTICEITTTVKPENDWFINFNS